MTFMEIRDACLRKEYAVEGMPFGPEALVYKAGTKMFALLSEDGDIPRLSLKCDPYLAQDYRERYPSVIPGYHFNKRHWNTVICDGTVPDAEILKMLDHSYDLVIQSLSKSERDGLTKG